MESNYRSLLEVAPGAMVVVSQGGGVILGQKLKNIIPEGFAERLLADGLRSADKALAQQIGTEIEPVERRKDCSEFPIELMQSQ